MLTIRHLRSAGERGLSPAQLADITGCTQKQALGALSTLWADFQCWRWYCPRRGSYVYTEPETQLKP